MTRYILLRDETGNWRRPPDALWRHPAPRAPDAPCRPSLEVVDLPSEAAVDVRAAPEVLALAPVMPTRLIAPQPMDGLRAADAVPGWGPRAVGADRTRFSGAGTRVAVLDTGIDAGHPAFAGVTVTARDFVGTGVDDANGHGTHLAGTILGRDQGGTRIGIARGIDSVLIGKVLADDGRGRSDAFLGGLIWSWEAGADLVVIALALDLQAMIDDLTAEGQPQSLALATALHGYVATMRLCGLVLRMMAAGQGPLVLAAAGNDSLRTVADAFETGTLVPAGLEGVLSVGACGKDEGHVSLAPFSNTGATLVAPGVAILSAASPSGLRLLNGSSMAVAHAAGLAALWHEKLRADGGHPSARALARALVQSAEPPPPDTGGGPDSRPPGLVQAPGSDWA